MGGDHRRGSSHVSSASTSSSSSFMTEPESSHTSQSSSSPEASPTSSKSPTQNGITISTEGHVNQLQETLITERDALTVNLKSARRESQKADAALRVEIETFQRSSEKLRSFRATCKAKDPCSSGSAKTCHRRSSGNGRKDARGGGFVAGPCKKEGKGEEGM